MEALGTVDVSSEVSDIATGIDAAAHESGVFANAKSGDTSPSIRNERALAFMSQQYTP